MSQADASPDDGDESDVWITEQLARYRNIRDHIEREALPLATSVDGRRFECQASLHGLRLRRGGYVTLESDSGARLGQITELSSRTIEAAVATGEGGTTDMLVRLAVGSGTVLDAEEPFHDAHIRPATPDEVRTWFDGTRPQRATLTVGELSLAPGVPAVLDSAGLSRHTFMCGQSGSGKTYSLGLVLEQVLAETNLRILILDPNSDYVGLGRLRADADPARAGHYSAITDGIAVWSNEPGADRPLRVRFAELESQTQGAILGLDPIRDRDEYAVLSDLLRANVDGTQLITGLDQLLDSRSPGARQLGLRAANLGLQDWNVWARDHHSLLEELKNPTARCVVVDLGSLDTMDEQRLVADAVLSTLWSQRRQRDPVLVVIDEAHNVCAADPGHPISRITTERAVQIAAEGRKYGLYLLASTQRPGKVHENVVSQCDNLVLMRMNSTADLADLGRLFSFVDPGLLAGAPSFAMGQALVSGRLFPQGAGYVQMGARVSEEGGADIPISWARPWAE